MKKALVLLAAAALPLGACTTYDTDDTLASAGTGAVIGAAGGAGVAAVTGGDVGTGAMIGAAAGALAGAVWADQNRDGQVDGYVYQGNYYPGDPANYQTARVERCRSVLGTAVQTGVAGAAAGAGAGALIGGLGVLEGALIGAAVGSIGGAVWADANNDGCADGYVREGVYYYGAPGQNNTNVAYTGEKG